MKSKKSNAIAAYILAAFAASSPFAYAANTSWVASPTDANWATGANWAIGTAPGTAAGGYSNATRNADVATFNQALSGGIGGSSNPIVIDANRFLASITFGTGAGAYVIGASGANTLQLDRAGSITMQEGVTEAQKFSGDIRVRRESSNNATYNFVNNSTTPSATLTFDVPAFTLTSANGRPTTLTLTGTNTGENTISSNITNAMGGQNVGIIVKNGTGKWVLSGSNSFTFTSSTNQGIQINAGTLVAKHSNALGSANSTATQNQVSINSTGILEIAGGIALRDGIIVGLKDGGTFRSNGTNSSASTLAVANAASGTISTVSASDVFTIGNAANDITGGDSTSTINVAGPGTVNLVSANNYAGKWSVQSGTLLLGNEAALGTPTSVQLAYGASSTGLVQTNGFSPTLVSLSSNGGTPILENGNATDSILTVNGSGITTFGGLLRDGSGGGKLSLVRSGTAGALTLSSPNTFTGDTNVTGGSLLITNTTGSGTGTGNINVSGVGTFGGTGIASGAVTIQTGGNLAPGASVGTLTVGGLTLDAGSKLTYEFAGSNDTTIVSATDGLTINGGAFTLLQENSITPFATTGTYNLIQYTGTIGGSGVSSLSVSNPQSGLSYAFGTAGGYVTLTITVSGVIGEWNVDGSSDWGTTGNWTGGLPNAQGAAARFNLALTADATVSLNGSKTVGGIVFTSASNDYTIDAGTGGSLIFDDTTGTASLDIFSGTHTIAANVTLTDTLDTLTTNATDSLTLSGVVSGAGGITKTGAGNLILSGANTFGGNVSLSGGQTTFTSGSLGAGTNLALNNAGLIYATGNTNDITAKTVTLGAGTATINTNGNNVTFANTINGDGALTKTGDGTLTLAGVNGFLGNLTITQGAVKLGNGAATGEVVAEIINNSVLQLDLLDSTPADVTVFNTISGTGSLQHLGTGTTALNGANTFTGDTIIATGGTLKLANNLALQNSTLQYPTAGGSLSFGPLTNATIGNLTGSKNLALDNAAEIPGAVALTIGGNNTSTTYSGILSGAGSLTKTGTGVLTLSGLNTYAGATAVNNNGQMILDATAGIASSALTVSQNATFTVDGGNVAISGATTVTNAGTTAPKLIVNSGTAAFTGGLFGTGNQNSAYLIALNGGTVSAGNVTLGRTNQGLTAEPTTGSTTQGLYVNGAAFTITGDIISANTNSSINIRMDSGSITVGGVTTIGLNNGGRWSVMDVAGGDFQSTNAATGVVLGSNFAGHAAFLVRNAGKATVQRIQMGQTIPGVDPAPATPVAGTHVVHVSNGGQLCIGTGGIVDGSTANAATVKITNGNLSACGTWSTDVPVILTGGCIIQAEDATATSYDISLAGSVSGTGSVEKTGAGKVTMGDNQYSGNTTVTAGTLSLGVATLHDESTVDLATGSVLELTHSATDDVKELIIGGITKAPGIYNAANSGGAITGTGSIRVLAQGYDAFAIASGLTVGVNDGKMADPDNDGVSNQLEYILGGNPLTSDASILPQQTVSGGNLTLTFKRSDLSESDTVVKVQVTTDLQTWPTELAIGATSAASASGVTVVEDSPNAELDTITVVIPVGSDGKKFVRVHSTMAQ